MKKIIFIIFLSPLIAVSQINNLIHNALCEQPLNEKSPFYSGLVESYTIDFYSYNGNKCKKDSFEKNLIDLEVWEADMKIINDKNNVYTLYAPPFSLNKDTTIEWEVLKLKCKELKLKGIINNQEYLIEFEPNK